MRKLIWAQLQRIHKFYAHEMLPGRNNRFIAICRDKIYDQLRLKSMSHSDTAQLRHMLIFNAVVIAWQTQCAFYQHEAKASELKMQKVEISIIQQTLSDIEMCFYAVTCDNGFNGLSRNIDLGPDFFARIRQ